MHSALVLASLLVLAAPQHPHVVRYAPHVVLGWTHDGERVWRFEVERAIAGGAFKRIGTPGRDARTFRDPTSRPGVTYLYRLRAVGADAVSRYSDEILVKVRTAR
ncbi:MAG: hypothetical protein HYR51_03565 [Candidatus Rokubacteria bacterium]|nr:hypothetical protein [Candidatus Rokubacteria bacterium]